MSSHMLMTKMCFFKIIGIITIIYYNIAFTVGYTVISGEIVKECFRGVED